MDNVVKDFSWLEMSREEKTARKKELIKLCKDFPELAGTDYADLEEEYICLLRLYENLLDKFTAVMVQQQDIEYVDHYIVVHIFFLCQDILYLKRAYFFL